MEIKTQKVDMDIVKYFEKLGYSSKEFKPGFSVSTTSFPIILSLQLGFCLGALKAHTAIKNMVKRNKKKLSPILEIYTDNNIEYFMSMDNKS